MAEEALEGDTRKREEVEARLGVATEVLERAAEEAERREAEEDLRREAKEDLSRVEEGERLEVQRLAAERQIKSLDSMEAKHLEA